MKSVNEKYGVFTVLIIILFLLIIACSDKKDSPSKENKPTQKPSNKEGVLDKMTSWVPFFKKEQNKAEPSGKKSADYEDTLRQRIQDWIIVKGKWEIKEQMLKYLGPEDEKSSEPYGIILSRQKRMWQGSFETVVNFKGKGGSHIIFSYNPVNKNYYTAGIGRISEQFGSGVVITEFQNGIYNNINSFGGEENFVKNADYAIMLSIQGNQVSMTVNNMKLASVQVPHLIYGDGVGLFAYGVEPIEFKTIKVNSAQP